MSENKEIHEYTDEELLAEVEQTKPYKTYDSGIFGFLVGVALWATVTKGLGLLTLLPLIYLPIAGKNRKRRQALLEELDNRGLT